MSMAQIRRIRAKTRAKSVRLEPVLTRAQVEAFEEHYGVTLPKGYRQFLLHIGNGGNGPMAYGLEPLETLPDRKLSHIYYQWPERSNITEVFPFTRRWIWENGETTTEGTRDQVDNGRLFIGTDGCGADWYLIITGPERGSPWLIDGDGIEPTAPKRDFLQWYEDWLEGKHSFYAIPGVVPTNPI